MSSGAYNDSELASLMTVFLMRSITIAELQGFRDALLELAVPIQLGGGHELLDIVGTGGDGKNTFNISTLSCFIVAGAGQKVAKHGNYGASTISGSSNVMEQLGYICFLHAPLFHPALKLVGPIRKNLGVRTFFNMLGPLVNPAKPAHQLIGVYSLEMARIYHYLLQEEGINYTIIHGLDGYDEISLTSDTKIFTAKGERIVSANELGKRIVFPEDLAGGDTVEASAQIFLKIIKGEGTMAQNAVVLANAAAALFATQKYNTYNDAYAAAVESLDSQKAYQVLQQLIAVQ
jgi:anthranilate phosphoribosyltransferase